MSDMEVLCRIEFRVHFVLKKNEPKKSRESCHAVAQRFQICGSQGVVWLQVFFVKKKGFKGLSFFHTHYRQNHSLMKNLTNNNRQQTTTDNNKQPHFALNPCIYPPNPPSTHPYATAEQTPPSHPYSSQHKHTPVWSRHSGQSQLHTHILQLTATRCNTLQHPAT